MLRRRSCYRIGGALFVAALVGLAFYAAYSGVSVRERLLSEAARQTNKAPPAQDCGADLKAKPWQGGDIPLALAYIACALEAIGAKEDSPDKIAREESDVDAQWQMAKWAGWMVAVTFAQVVMGGIGIYYIRRTLRENRRGIAAASRGARAAFAAIKITEATAKRELRAYVYFEFDSRRWPPEEPTENDLILRVINKGQTWARDVRIEHHRVTLTKTTALDPFIEAQWQREPPPPQLLGPGQIISLRLGTVSFEEGAVLADDRVPDANYFVARVRYRDAIDGKTVWETQGSRRLNTDANEGISWTWMPTHNCADEDCPKEGAAPEENPKVIYGDW